MLLNIDKCYYATGSTRPKGILKILKLKHMVGLIADAPRKCIKSFKKSIGLPDIAAQRHLLKTPGGIYIHEPSRELGKLVRFDTEHSRAELGNQPDHSMPGASNRLAMNVIDQDRIDRCVIDLYHRQRLVRAGKLTAE